MQLRLITTSTNPSSLQHIPTYEVKFSVAKFRNQQMVFDETLIKILHIDTFLKVRFP